MLYGCTKINLRISKFIFSTVKGLVLNRKEAGKKVPASNIVFGYHLNAVSSWQFRSSFQTPNQPNSFRGGETTKTSKRYKKSPPMI